MSPLDVNMLSGELQSTVESTAGARPMRWARRQDSVNKEEYLAIQTRAPCAFTGAHSRRVADVADVLTQTFPGIPFSKFSLKCLLHKLHNCASALGPKAAVVNAAVHDTAHIR